jgi:hypothetical protein
MFARLGNALLAFSLIVAFSAGTATPIKATGATGPIQLGGDDANDHGESDWIDHDNDVATPDVVTVIDGWKYIEVSLKQMLATEQRAGATNSIAVIGTNGTSAYVTGEGWTENDGGASCTTAGASDTYCMMEVIKAELDRLNGVTAAPTVTYYETAAEVTAFFNALTAGTANVAVVYIPGDDGTNDLGEGEDNDQVDNDQTATSNMEQALMDSASDIATFNVQGGGLLSSGSDNYLSWLSVLIPTIGIAEDPTSSEIGMTADGAALWVGLYDEDIYAPWHNHFTGSLGALKVLGLGFESWTDTNTNKMIDTGEATALMWDGPDATNGTADDAQTIAIIGGAAGEAAIGEELPPTNTDGDATASWALLVAALAAVAGLALRVVERKRLQA